MKDYEDEAFDELEKSLQRKVAHGVTDGSKVTIDRDKLKLVLEALEINLIFLKNVKPFKGQENLASDCVAMTDETITTLKEALEDV